MCEDCKQKQAAWGSPADNKRRWCEGCGKKHGGAKDLTAKALRKRKLRKDEAPKQMRGAG